VTTVVQLGRLLVAAVALGICAGGCTSITPTAAPPAPSAAVASPSAAPTSSAPTARPSIAGPGWVQDAAARWDPGSPQWNALANPDVPYRLGGSAFENPNGITFTPNLARKWWDAWFANPVDRSSVPTGLQPGGLVLSAGELKRVAELQSGSLPPAPADYNPLGLPILP
jgi:hypothetical protein